MVISDYHRQCEEISRGILARNRKRASIHGLAGCPLVVSRQDQFCIIARQPKRRNAMRMMMPSVTTQEGMPPPWVPASDVCQGAICVPRAPGPFSTQGMRTVLIDVHSELPSS